jgi:GNAT superfamily N-acetyltransferase
MSAGAISLRRARPDEAAQIVAFQLALARETEALELDAVVVTRGVAAVFADAAKGAYWVAEGAEGVIGCLLTTPEWSDWRAGTVLWIQSVYVIPQARGRGVFRALYEHLQREVNASTGLRGLRLYVARGNTAAQQVYAHLGMDGEHYQLFEWMP